ncbi:MAG: hypothetical protein IKS17_02855 [Firmicutes bacterium]|nr:hypothetical protein [Bacillota bacterium]
MIKKAIEHFYTNNWLAILTEILPKFSKDGYYKKIDGIKEITQLAAPITKREKTDMSVFEKSFGIALPNEIDDYINAYWHIGISGRYTGVRHFILDNDEVSLFPVLKLKHQNNSDFLYDPNNGFMTYAKYWHSVGGDITQFIPIGITVATAYFILYDVSTGMIYLEDDEVDFLHGTDPIARSLSEFIENIEVPGRYEVESVTVKDTKSDQYMYGLYKFDLNETDKE